MKHWAINYIGIPWTENGRTSAGFDCLGLVMDVQEKIYNKAVPTHAETLEEASHLIPAFGWRYVSQQLDDARDGDILTMRGAGGAHVGTVFELNDLLYVLHAHGSREQTGSVIATPLQDITASYGRLKIWRNNVKD